MSVGYVGIHLGPFLLTILAFRRPANAARFGGLIVDEAGEGGVPSLCCFERNHCPVAAGTTSLCSTAASPSALGKLTLRFEEKLVSVFTQYRAQPSNLLLEAIFVFFPTHTLPHFCLPSIATTVLLYACVSCIIRIRLSGKQLRL
jgi:hypothetical protein